jgi:hypothetical protein
MTVLGTAVAVQARAGVENDRIAVSAGTLEGAE